MRSSRRLATAGPAIAAILGIVLAGCGGHGAGTAAGTVAEPATADVTAVGPDTADGTAVGLDAVRAGRSSSLRAERPLTAAEWESLRGLAGLRELELEHGRAVASLAGRIWEQLAEPLGLDPADRPLLECAARLQDVGYVINYDNHHKHSYHLIRNSRLPGIRAHDLELIANVARYHRGAHPKKKHENLLRLTPADQRRVLAMASVVRLAGGAPRAQCVRVDPPHERLVQLARPAAHGQRSRVQRQRGGAADERLRGPRRT